MRRVVVLGRGGAGKSTFAARLGAALGVPVIELDRHFWSGDLTPLSRADWVLVQERLVATKSAECSAHSIGLVGEEYVWSLLNLNNDDDGKGNDRVLNAPTSEAWIDPWVDHLRALGVTLRTGQSLVGLELDGAHLTGATVADGSGARQPVRADYYVSAIPLDRFPAVFTPELLAVAPALTGAGTPGIAYDDAIFIQNPGSWYDRPDAATAVDNLFLAGDWIRTQMNVACMEGANEGGRLAANAVLRASGAPGTPAAIVPRYRMPLWEPLKRLDSALYKAGRPNAFDIIDHNYPVR